jgi:hypothetical protein
MAQEWKSDVPLEERKRRLLAEGALFRIGIMEGRSTVRANLNAESLAKGALTRLIGAVSSTFSGALFSKGRSNLQSLSPLLIGGISLLSKRYLRKPLLYGGVVGVGAVVAYYLTRKKGRAGGEEVSTPDGE